MKPKTGRCYRCGQKTTVLPDIQHNNIIVYGGRNWLCQKHLTEYENLIKNEIISETIKTITPYKDPNGAITKKLPVDPLTKLTTDENKLNELATKLRNGSSYFSDKIIRDIKGPKDRILWNLMKKVMKIKPYDPKENK